MAEFFKKRKKICYMCAGKDIDYKDVEILRKYINEKGKILPRTPKTYCITNQKSKINCFITIYKIVI